MKILLVEWVDADSDDEWKELSDIELTMPVVKTVGWLLAQDNDIIVLGQNVATDGDISCYMRIPKGWIKKTTTLLE